MDNCKVEIVHDKLRDECLNPPWFQTIAEAREVIEAWRIDYDTTRPCSSLGGCTPSEYAAKFLKHEWQEEQHQHFESFEPNPG